MKLRGVVKGKTIELEVAPGLPDGQRVQVELEVATTETVTETKPDQDLETRIATDPAFEDIRQARALRERIAAQRGGKLLNSVDLIREDRSR
jgi:hypothetical protein